MYFNNTWNHRGQSEQTESSTRSAADVRDVLDRAICPLLLFLLWRFSGADISLILPKCFAMRAVPLQILMPGEFEYMCHGVERMVLTVAMPTASQEYGEPDLWDLWVEVGQEQCSDGKCPEAA